MPGSTFKSFHFIGMDQSEGEEKTSLKIVFASVNPQTMELLNIQASFSNSKSSTIKIGSGRVSNVETNLTISCKRRRGENNLINGSAPTKMTNECHSVSLQDLSPSVGEKKYLRPIREDHQRRVNT